MSAIHNFKIWRNFCKLSFIQALSFRLNFAMGVIEGLIFYGIQLLTIEVLYANVGNINGWSRSEFLFYWAFIITCMDHFYTFVVGNLWRFADDDIRNGNLDFKLLKPAPTLFSCFFSRISAGSLLLFWIPWSCLIYFAIQVNLSLVSWILLPIMVIFSFVFISSLLMLMTLATMWTIQGYGINYVRFQLSQFVFWPDFVFQNKIRFFLSFVIPILLVGSGPIRFMLNPADWTLLITMLLMQILILLLIKIVWHAGLKRYSSASS